MIKVTWIEEQRVEHFNPNNESVGFLTHTENLYLRCRIKEIQESGWYLMFEGIKVEIRSDGGMKYPKNLYNETTDLLNELLLYN